MTNHKVKVIFPENANDELNDPYFEGEGDWWITDGESKPDDRPHWVFTYQSDNYKKTVHTFYFHLHRILHAWLVEQNISYTIDSIQGSDSVHAIVGWQRGEEWCIIFENESDAILFKLT